MAKTKEKSKGTTDIQITDKPVQTNSMEITPQKPPEPTPAVSDSNDKK
jgi:hypothetical protein